MAIEGKKSRVKCGLLNVEGNMLRVKCRILQVEGDTILRWQVTAWDKEIAKCMCRIGMRVLLYRFLTIGFTAEFHDLICFAE